MKLLTLYEVINMINFINTRVDNNKVMNNVIFFSFFYKYQIVTV